MAIVFQDTYGGSSSGLQVFSNSPFAGLLDQRKYTETIIVPAGGEVIIDSVQFTFNIWAWADIYPAYALPDVVTVARIWADDGSGLPGAELHAGQSKSLGGVTSTGTGTTFAFYTGPTLTAGTYHIGFDMVTYSGYGSISLRKPLTTSTSWSSDYADLDGQAPRAAYSYRTDLGGPTWLGSSVSYHSLVGGLYSSSGPGLPTSPSPTNTGSALPGLQPLSWTAPDYDGETFVSYSVYVKEDGDAWGAAHSISYSDATTEATSPSLTGGLTYQWRVDYEFDVSGVVTGTTWEFTVEYVELSGTCEGISDGSGNLPVDLSGTSVSVSAGGTGAGGGSGSLTGFLDVVSPPTEINVTKTLYAIANNEFWYESSDNTMSELAAANGDMNVNLPMQTVPAFQKCFMANKWNLKVADFVNVRLTSEAKISTNVPSHGAILTQVTSGASMVVDYIYYDTTATDHYVYGRQISTADFDTTNDVRDVDTNVIITGANLSAVTASPHWYDWTSYNSGEDTSFAGMPTGAQLVCLYRGRLVLAGNPNDPYQWYMSRQANPWDWNYTAADAQSPVAGGNGLMGKAGDVIKALIPFHDDYLILGCQQSMLVMRGDPALGGSLDVLDSNTGIFGPKAYCFDSEGNLYFYGTSGLYFAPRDIFQSGSGKLINLSKNALPNL